jgi:hypothetical protein
MKQRSSHIIPSPMTAMMPWELASIGRERSTGACVGTVPSNDVNDVTMNASSFVMFVRVRDKAR